jgi:hypothetical protein
MLNLILSYIVLTSIYIRLPACLCIPMIEVLER